MEIEEEENKDSFTPRYWARMKPSRHSRKVPLASIVLLALRGIISGISHWIVCITLQFVISHQSQAQHRNMGRSRNDVRRRGLHRGKSTVKYNP